MEGRAAPQARAQPSRCMMAAAAFALAEDAAYQA
jgi:hypothetical protein